eukprot:5371006-Amphidinium_carterae.1
MGWLALSESPRMNLRIIQVQGSASKPKPSSQSQPLPLVRMVRARQTALKWSVPLSSQKAATLKLTHAL